jgi:hypothetical protein
MLPSEGKGHTFESCRVRQYYAAFSQFSALLRMAGVTTLSLTISNWAKRLMGKPGLSAPTTKLSAFRPQKQRHTAWPPLADVRREIGREGGQSLMDAQ